MSPRRSPSPTRHARQRGSTLITFAFILAVLVPVAGLAIDTLMLTIAKERLTAAVHSAANAAARSTNPDSAAERFCKANFPDGYLGTKSLAIAVANGKVTARLQAPTYFMRMFRIESIAVAAESEMKPATVARANGTETNPRF